MYCNFIIIFNNNNKNQKSLINEINLMRLMNHSNIVKLYEVYESDNSIYMILGLVKGGDLKSKMQNYINKAHEIR